VQALRRALADNAGTVLLDAGADANSRWFKVAARNVAGLGPASAFSNIIQPT